MLALSARVLVQSLDHTWSHLKDFLSDRVIRSEVILIKLFWTGDPNSSPANKSIPVITQKQDVFQEQHILKRFIHLAPQQSVNDFYLVMYDCAYTYRKFLLLLKLEQFLTTVPSLASTF